MATSQFYLERFPLIGKPSSFYLAAADSDLLSCGSVFSTSRLLGQTKSRIEVESLADNVSADSVLSWAGHLNSTSTAILHLTESWVRKDSQP